ncbi:DUF6036 family nucleotidyltransferase [Tenuibacillus multivorans]|uniref:DUF6036 domain-containing protein n=1 Tax=Tenuibacillus multivorans TaxID=237069 RepID=A0A1H0G7A8_9BACI|nr:DUF6036 family nucleotidyltransferase [Tenuibacillus multivorans]GEL78715.1 hypothetical protein TMU01_29500 [Tenuibacillus multivorans]SDO02740.1 hypothetical protein SAMN05216498_0484 [Tenuibacillus multivorans]
MDRLHSSDDILTKLNILDHICQTRGIVAELAILGGSGILLYMENIGQSFRPTQDIDVNLINTNDIQKLTEALSEAGIDLIGGISEVPPLEDYTNIDFLYEINAEFDNLRIFVPDIELLACFKIFSSREKDLIDLKETDILKQCNKEKLIGLVDEYKQYILKLDNPDLNLHQLFHILKEKGI